jgi:DNA ligase-1
MLLHKLPNQSNLNNPFSNSSYISELKLDGFRCIYSKINNQTKIFTRHKTDITSKFPELLTLPIPDGTILDGEIIVTDNEGKPDFEACMNRFMSNSSTHEISFSVFDIIYYQNEKVTHLPLLKRKELLSKVIPTDTPLLNKVQFIEGYGEQYFELTKQQQLEGIVLKKADSTYQINKRSSDWLKVINYQYETVSITGLRKNEFGLLLSFPNGSYAGLMEFMSPDNRKEFYKQYRQHISSENDKFIYLDPNMKAKVKYRNLTSKGLLRIPSFVDWIS